MTPYAAPVTLENGDAAALRADLAPWTVDAVHALVGGCAVGALLTRLLMLGDTLTRADVERGLPRLGAEGAERCGIVVASGAGDDDDVRALVDLRPYGTADGGEVVTWWAASDTGEAVTSGQLEGDHVLGIGGATATLASVTMRNPVGRVLDLGTGCGVQALHASLHARDVVATDVSRRARLR